MPEKITPLYHTVFGKAFVGDALDLLDRIKDDSINLVITSPPFALLRKKEYGNKPQEEYVDWLTQFARKVKRILQEDGSFVLDLGGAYEKGKPVRSLYNYRILIKFCDELGFYLAEEFFWFNPSKLPSPIEWVNKRKIRVKDSVNTVWWFSKSEFPKADVRNVLVPYSERMKKLLKDSDKYYTPKKRPSGHDISGSFARSNGGAIPPNFLQIPNTESNSKYLRYCKMTGVKGHPARFPVKLPQFFIKFLTEPNDIVLDIFAGSNATGEAAEILKRKWLAFEIDREYLAASAFRFIKSKREDAIIALHTKLLKNRYSDIPLMTLETKELFIDLKKNNFSEIISIER
ncbi:MAG: site-specific DNA-methyltransferase [Deltaproteobacteria bacterium]|nr:site-specific DNA-methyltransferase [Deltaproteobacteria bacterium]